MFGFPSSEIDARWGLLALCAVHLIERPGHMART